MLANIPLLLMINSPCFLIAVMLPSICGHESFLQECYSLFILCENVRLGDGYTDDKYLSRVSLTCFIIRTRWLDILIFNSWTHHTHSQLYHMICCFIDGLYCGVSWCIVSWIFAISLYRITAKALYRDFTSFPFNDLFCWKMTFNKLKNSSVIINRSENCLLYNVWQERCCHSCSDWWLSQQCTCQL